MEELAITLESEINCYLDPYDREDFDWDYSVDCGFSECEVVLANDCFTVTFIGDIMSEAAMDESIRFCCNLHNIEIKFLKIDYGLQQCIIGIK